MFHSDRVKHQLIISEQSFVEMACSEYFPPKLIKIPFFKNFKNYFPKKNTIFPYLLIMNFKQSKDLNIMFQ